MKKCIYCEAENFDNAKNCIKCGKDISFEKIATVRKRQEPEKTPKWLYILSFSKLALIVGILIFVIYLITTS